MSALRLFLAAMEKRWWALLSCAAFTLLALYALATNQNNHWLLVASIIAALICFLVASFGAWKEQYDARLAAERRLHDGRPVFVLEVVGTLPLRSNPRWRFLLTNCGARTARYVRLSRIRSQVGAYEISFSEIPALQAGPPATLGYEVIDRRKNELATLWDFASDNTGGTYLWYDVRIEYRDMDESVCDGGIVRFCFDMQTGGLSTAGAA